MAEGTAVHIINNIEGKEKQEVKPYAAKTWTPAETLPDDV